MTKRRCHAFTLVELLVVIGIIAILIAIILPAMTRARESARQVQCATQLRGLGQGLANYAASNHGFYPGWSGWHTIGGDGTGDDEEGPGWMEVLERYYAKATSPVYNCPSFPEGFPMNYFLSSRWLQQNRRHNLKMSEISVSSHFILAGEATHPHLYPPWYGNASDGAHVYRTDDCDKDDAVGPGLAFMGEPGGLNLHHAGNNVLFGDGHVGMFKRFDPHEMTYHPHVEGVNWDEVTGD